MWARIVLWLGSITGVVGVVVDILNKVLSVFTKAIANSKLYCTILLLGIVVVVWNFSSKLLDDLINAIVGIDTMQGTLDASFLSNFCTPSNIYELGKTVLNAFVTYYTVFASGIGYSLLIKIHGMSSRSIVV